MRPRGCNVLPLHLDIQLAVEQITVLLCSQDFDKALETYEAGLKQDPDNAELKEGVSRSIRALNDVRKQLASFGCPSLLTT